MVLGVRTPPPSRYPDTNRGLEARQPDCVDQTNPVRQNAKRFMDTASGPRRPAMWETVAATLRLPKGTLRHDVLAQSWHLSASRTTLPLHRTKSHHILEGLCGERRF
jgi:hypothetical protein